MIAATVAVHPHCCIHLVLVGLDFHVAFPSNFLCLSSLICSWISAEVSWVDPASCASLRNLMAQSWRTMTMSCHTLGNTPHESCFCAHTRMSMVQYSYLDEEESSYGVAARFRMHACAFVSARCFLAAPLRAVLPDAWTASSGDAR